VCHAAGSSPGKDEQPSRQLEDSKRSVAKASSDDNSQDDGKDVAPDHVVGPSTSPEMMSESSGDEPMIISEDQARSNPEDILGSSVDSYAGAEHTLIVSSRCVSPFLPKRYSLTFPSVHLCTTYAGQKRVGQRHTFRGICPWRLRVDPCHSRIGTTTSFHQWRCSTIQACTIVATWKMDRGRGSLRCTCDSRLQFRILERTCGNNTTELSFG
jgi:hypothetical protein